MKRVRPKASQLAATTVVGGSLFIHLLPWNLWAEKSEIECIPVLQVCQPHLFHSLQFITFITWWEKWKILIFRVVFCFPPFLSQPWNGTWRSGLASFFFLLKFDVLICLQIWRKRHISSSLFCSLKISYYLEDRSHISIITWWRIPTCSRQSCDGTYTWRITGW